MFYLPLASDSAGQLKLGQRLVLRSENEVATCDPEPNTASGGPPGFTLALESPNTRTALITSQKLALALHGRSGSSVALGWTD